MMTPLWLLDVDGVLNALATPAPPGYESLTCRGFVITYRPSVIARIRELHESGQVEVRWLTTWCHEALELGQLLGMPVLEVEGADEFRRTGERWWKSIAAERLLASDPDRPLIWTDDDLTWASADDEVDWALSRAAPTLMIAPSLELGLIDEDLDRVTAFTVARRDSSVGGCTTRS